VTHCTPSVSEIPIVAVEDELDPHTIDALQRRLTRALGVGRGFVVVDLRAVRAADAEASNLLCGALRRVERHDARLALAGAPPAACRVLERSEIDGVELYPTLGTAVAAATRARPSSYPPAPGPRVQFTGA
jgi:anti-anti-sigma factor